MSPNRKAGEALFARARVRSAVRRGLAQVGPLDRAAHRYVDRRRGYERLLALYESLRSAYAPRRPVRDVPTEADVERVRENVLKGKIYENFIDVLCVDGDFDRALVSTTRRLIGAGENGRARSLAQVLQQYDHARPVADICAALCAFVEPMPDTAWKLFGRNKLQLVVSWAAHEYFELAFAREPEAGAAALERVLTGSLVLEADPDIWLQIAYQAFSAGFLDLTRRTLERAEAAIGSITDPARLERLHARLAGLRSWSEDAGRDKQPPAVPADEVPFALVGFRHPDWRVASTDLADPTESLAALGHLLRHSGVRFSGDPALVSTVERLRQDVPAERRLDAAASGVRLYEVQRDLSGYAEIPPGTWTIVSRWLTAPLGGRRYDLPLHPNLRPIFVSFHITPTQLAAPGVVEYLRRHAPIGCRDRDSALLLHAAGIPAFYSGALTATVDNLVAPASPSEAPAGTVFLDVAPDGPGEQRSRFVPQQKQRSLAENLAAAAAALCETRDAGARVVTADVRSYLAARAVGCPAEFRPAEPADYRVIDFVDLSDADLTAMQRGISDKLATVLGAVLAARSEAEVYAAWATACAADVAKLEAELRDVPPDPQLSFDLEAVCKAIRAEAVTIERSEPGPEGPEMNIEFSLDANYKHQFDIVLDSVVERASRPVRAFVLCREHGPADYERMARLFPTVSFVWLPSDNVDFGRIVGMNKWVTAATMDRTIMPVLLDDIERIIHFDLDAMALGDLAELYDVDFEGMALAAAPEPQPRYVGGYDTIRRTARRMRREGNPELAREFMIRMHARHEFDFDIFNAGIMVLNLQKMREDDFCGRFLPYLQTYGVNGQTVICVYVGRHFKVVDADWNRLMRLEVPDTPKIAHWAGPFKPWAPHQYVWGRELWRAQEQRFAARTRQLAAVGAQPG